MKSFVGLMDVWRVVLGVILLLCASLIQLNSDLVDNWTENSNSDTVQEDYQYTLIQSEERWLVLPVSFSNNNLEISKIEQIFSGDGSAEEYLSLMTNGATELEVAVKDVWKTSSPVKQWGEDVNGERDYGSDGNGVESLVNSVVLDVLSEEDLSPWDLNDDGVIDRLLLIHSAPPQESTGNSNSFWSHFSLMDNPIEIQDWRIEHYVVASIDSGLGTIVHESLHSMGALDLYDVHDELPTSNWNGVGDWGIMASGNWNGEGDIPAMPISSTLDLIGVNNSIEVDTSIQSSFELYPLTDGGFSLKVQIATNEWIRFTFRGGADFDSSLPGSGILVEHQNRNFGDESDNLVNTNPNFPWVKIIEADGDSALVRGKDSGAASDTFVEGNILGSMGMQIRDSQGRLVTWSASIDELNSSSAIVSFTPVSQAPNIEVQLSSGYLEILEGESITAQVSSPISCDLQIDLHSSESSASQGPRVFPIEAGDSTIVILSASQITSSAGYLRGSIGCEGEGSWDIDKDWYQIGHRLETNTLEALIASDGPSSVTFQTGCIGDGARSYSIAIDGAASRIATVRSQGEFEACPSIEIDINPNDLLTPGMLARGDLVFVDSFGIEQRVPVEFTAKSSFNGNSPIAWLAQPSNGLSIILILSALVIVTGERDSHSHLGDEPKSGVGIKENHQSLILVDELE